MRRRDDIDGCLLMVMKCLWDADEELTSVDIREQIKVRYGKNYGQANICTFMSRLRKRGYVNYHKEGKDYYYSAAIEEKMVHNSKLAQFVDFWHGGSVARLAAEYCKDNGLTEEDFVRLMKNELLSNRERYEQES